MARKHQSRHTDSLPKSNTAALEQDAAQAHGLQSMMGARQRTTKELEQGPHGCQRAAVPAGRCCRSSTQHYN